VKSEHDDKLGGKAAPVFEEVHTYNKNTLHIKTVVAYDTVLFYINVPKLGEYRILKMPEESLSIRKITKYFTTINFSTLLMILHM